MGLRDLLGKDESEVNDQHEAFRERARQRALEKARKRRKILMPVGIAAVTAALVGIFLYSPLTAVASFNVLGPISDGQRNATKEQLNHFIGSQMINLNTKEVNDIVSNQRWVEASTTTKQWPQSVAVQIAVRKPAIVVKTPTGEWAMDKAGFFIGPADNTHSHLVRVATQRPVTDRDAVGTPGLVAAAEAVGVFPPAITDYVTQWSVEEGVGLVVDMKLEGVGTLESVQVIVGDAQDIPFKSSVIEKLIEDLARTGHRSSKIDVRVPSRPVVIG